MEIYEPNPKRQKETAEKRVFPVSVLNFRLPLWEKIVFFLIGWAGFQFISVVCSTILTPFVNSGAISNNLANCILMFLVYFLTLAAFVLLMIFDKRQTWKSFLEQFKEPKKYFLYGVLALAIILVVESVYTNIFSLALPDIYGANSNQSSIQTMIAISPVLLFFPVVIFAPLTEELTYRIGLVDSIGHNEKNRWYGIILSAVIFGFIHFDWSSVLYYFQYNVYYRELLQSTEATEETIKACKEVIDALGITCINELINLPIYIFSGMAFAYAYVKTGLLSTSITAHALNNLISFVMILVSVLSGSGSGSSSTSSIVSTTVGSLSGVLPIL